LADALAYLAATALVLALVRPWRSARSFVRLAFASALGFVVLANPHTHLHGIADVLADGTALRSLTYVLGAAAFLGAALACTPAFVVGVVGALSVFTRSRQVRLGR
jgi:hypothetical protein